jgi:type IV pilus assembly protein PilY1
MKRQKFLSFAVSTALALWLGYAPVASAELMDLSNVPLFLGFRAEPNIFFIIDDSGSMDWDVLTQDAFNEGRFTGLQPNSHNRNDGVGPVKHRDSNDSGYPNCNFGQNGQDFFGYIYATEFGQNSYDDDSLDCNTADDRAWRFRTNAFNTLYFDPYRTYSPWKGVDKQGNPFTDMDPTHALANPYDPSNSETINLLVHNSNWPGGTSRDTSDRDNDGQPDGFFFYTWTDANNNGLFDNGEETEHQLNNLDPAFLDTLVPTFGNGNPVTAQMVQTNFANWFSYHRSREHVAKAAYGEVIAGATAVRMGLATLHNHNNVKTEIRSMNADPASGNKKTLLSALYSINSADGTPLRNALHNAGKYLDCDSSNNLFSSSCPRLSAAEGGACQQNFALLMTDGFYNGGSPSLGNRDGDNSSDWDGGTYADGYSNTLADVAMRYYERDLHPDLDDNVPITPGIDEARHQHVVTYTVAFGVNGTLTDNPPNDTDPFAWPDPAQSAANKIDDLRHAAFNGRGEFLNASRPEELVTALNDALSSIADRVSSAASVALNSGSHNANSKIYQARFNSGDWSGQLLAYPIGEDGSVLTPVWDAGEELDTLDWDHDRTIITYNNELNNGTGIAFRWDQLSLEMKNLLNLDAAGVPDTNGEKRLEYLRGNKAEEGTLFRTRLHLLGDLIHSDPYFVGPPRQLYPELVQPDDIIGQTILDDYEKFRDEQYNNRKPMIYVNSNDGMLHGFNANTGHEEIAYVPRVLFSRLSRLSNPIYQHEYFADGSPTAGDAYGKFCGSGTSKTPCWRTVLVSGLRKGGQAIFALDVTDPIKFSEANASQFAMWEFSDQDDADLGYTFSQPSIVQMQNGRWAAVIGNGYNNSETDGIASTTGHAVLFIVFLDGGLDGAWTEGSDYIKLDTGVGEIDTPNGLASASPVDVDGDFVIDYIYAGDLRGNVWKFDVTNTTAGNWSSPVRLFTAESDVAVAGSTLQPITSRLEAGLHPEEGLLIYFGTGKYVEPSDNTADIPKQTFYGIWDKLTSAQTLPVPRDKLLKQTINSYLTNGYRTSSNKPINWEAGPEQHLGWRIDLIDPGERQVSDSILRHGRIIFITLIPDTEPCSFGGDSWLMELDAITGGRLSESPFDLNGDHKFDDEDLVNVSDSEEPGAISGIKSTAGILSTPAILPSGPVEYKFSSGSTGSSVTFTEDSGGGSRGRIAWRQFQ